MFRSIFSAFSKKEPPLESYSELGTDMHSHLIPGIDDGSKSIEDSLMLIRELKGLGYKKLITTPHIMSDYFRNTPENILAGLKEVREAVEEEGLGVEIEAAAEYYVDDGFIKKLENEPLLTFGDKHLLFEISYINCPENIEDIIFRMRVRGYKPVMAHPERYPFWYNNFDQYKRFHEQGVLLQVNTNSLSGYYGIDAKRVAERMAENGLIDLLGTDCHHMRHIEALKRGLKEKTLRKLLSSGMHNSQL